MGRVAVDLTGKTFGRLLVLSRVISDKSRSVVWLCRCECGNECTIVSSNLKNGYTRSCGCICTKHGKHDSSEYHAWGSMMQRCGNPKNQAYKNYGARGIIVCHRWHNASNFIADMGEKPSSKHSLDRINTNGNYSCGHCEECRRNEWTANCRWTTRKVQNSNTRVNRYVMHNEEKVTISEYAKRTGLSVEGVRNRIKIGKLQEVP